MSLRTHAVVVQSGDWKISDGGMSRQDRIGKRERKVPQEPRLTMLDVE